MLNLSMIAISTRNG